MTSFIKSAKHVHDVESDLSYVEVQYDRYIPTSHEYITFTDYINTEPLGDWVFLQSNTRSIQYEKFLDAMVNKTVEVLQRMSELMLDNILVYEHPGDVYIRIVHATKILDPSFQPPRINKESAWQVELMKNCCREAYASIQECINKSRLSYFFNVLHTINLQTI
jgi:hypothetical protein